MKDEGLLLTRFKGSSEETNIGKLLTFFGVSWRTLTGQEFFAQAHTPHESSTKSRVICSSDIFLQLILDLEAGAQNMAAWHNRIHSAFVYAGDDAEILRKLMGRITRHEGAALNETNSCAGDLVVSDQLRDFCGVMAGVRVAASKADLENSLIFNPSKENAGSIISCGPGATFFKLEYKGVNVFLSTFSKIIDLDAELTSQNFDIRAHFLSAVPFVLYVKWAFAGTCWSAPEMNACLVIDDPVLKSRHGFVNFQELLSLMQRHKFSTNIAFIPWNWRRSTPKVVQLFRENAGNFSISVHGCDHTRAEFGSSDLQRLYWKAQQALARMNHHQSLTGIRYDPVMVFPQGIFSEAAMNALKRTDLIAAVNNDVVSADLHPRTITLSELWDIAVMGYSSFPLFTRRYPWEGIENFAFDALLGKPAIIIIHHDYCSDGCLRLIQFIDRLNSLKYPPTWRSLGEVVRHSYRQRQLPSSQIEIEMYAAELRVENRCGQPRSFSIRRREGEPSLICEISDESGPLTWNSANGYITFEVGLSPGQSKVVQIRYHLLGRDGRDGDDLHYRFGAMLRRYLCEIRDNYVTTVKLRVANRLGSRDQKSEVRTQ